MKSSSASSVLVVAALASTTVSICVTAWWSNRKYTKLLAEWERRRQEERTGRIRAEQKLRKALNDQKNHSHQGGQNQSSSSSNGERGYSEHAMHLKWIGIVVSPYTKRMGTPRQGALVPSSRGYIQFHSSLPPEALEGIDSYSHLWVIFRFHANTSLATSKKSKIRPPRGGGIKVGQLATRSPHRPNDIGLSLVTLDRWEKSTYLLSHQTLRSGRLAGESQDEVHVIISMLFYNGVPHPYIFLYRTYWCS